MSKSKAKIENTAPTIMYALSVFTRFQDGSEESVGLHPSVEKCLEIINRGHNGGFGINPDNTTYRIFEVTVGKEIPIVKAVEELPQPPKVVETYRVVVGEV